MALDWMQTRPVDVERGFELEIVSGYRDGSWAAWVTGAGWAFKMRVYRSCDRYPGNTPPGLAPDEFVAWLDAHANPDYRTRLSVGVPLKKGVWDRPGSMLDLAEDLALEHELVGRDPEAEAGHIIVNGKMWRGPASGEETS